CGSRLQARRGRRGPGKAAVGQGYQNPPLGQVSVYPFSEISRPGTRYDFALEPCRAALLDRRVPVSYVKCELARGEGSMSVDRFGIAAGLLVALSPALAQEGFPLDGTWRGEWGENGTRV